MFRRHPILLASRAEEKAGVHLASACGRTRAAGGAEDDAQRGAAHRGSPQQCARPADAPASARVRSLLRPLLSRGGAAERAAPLRRPGTPGPGLCPCGLCRCPAVAGGVAALCARRRARADAHQRAGTSAARCGRAVWLRRPPPAALAPHTLEGTLIHPPVRAHSPGALATAHPAAPAERAGHHPRGRRGHAAVPAHQEARQARRAAGARRRAPAAPQPRAAGAREEEADEESRGSEAARAALRVLTSARRARIAHAPPLIRAATTA